MRLVAIVALSGALYAQQLYHGGPVVSAPPNIQVVWYGEIQDASRDVLMRFLAGYGGSRHLGIVAGYGATRKLGSISEGLVQSDLLLDQTLAEELVDSLAVDGITILVVSSAVHLYSYCNWYCAYHGFTPGRRRLYAVVGDPTNCQENCIGPVRASPNRNRPADAMVQHLAHELAEILTDPYLDAWYDDRGAEMADVCAWRFGRPLRIGPDDQDWANVKLETGWFLLPELMTRGGVCALSDSGPPRAR